MNEQLDPQPGETLYCESTYHGLSRVSVERLTNTQIIINSNTKIRRPFSEGCCEIGASSYSRSYYYRDRLDLKSKYEKQELVKFIQAFVQSGKVAVLTILQLEKIKEIIS